MLKRRSCMLQSMGLQKVGHDLETEQQQGKLGFLGSQWHLLLGSKVMTNLDSIFKRRDISLPTKIRLVKAMVFPVVMY